MCDDNHAVQGAEQMDAKYGCSRTNLDELAHLPVISLSDLLDSNRLDALPQCFVDLHPPSNMVSTAVIH